MQYIALGANLEIGDFGLGDSLARALQSMADEGLSIRRVSRFFRTPCFPEGAGPDYVNAVVGVDSGLKPQALLRALHQIEAKFGRIREERWGQRTLDLDLLTYDSIVCPNLDAYDHWRKLPLEVQRIRAPEELILPHPRMHERAFVLVPLADIAPNWRHPVLQSTIQELLSQLDSSDIKAVVPL